MNCLRCGYCCFMYDVMIVDDPEAEITEGNIIHKHHKKRCKHLSGDTNSYSCNLHNKEWYEETPCYQHNLEYNKCRMGEHFISEKETSALVRAEKFVNLIHKNQKYGDKPYTFHLENVVSVLKRYFPIEGNEELFVSAWLHDSIEDNEYVTKDFIDFHFGLEISEIVFAVTGEGETRKERNDSMYSKIKSNPKARIIKIADRISNVDQSKQNNPKKFNMYASEFNKFKKEVFNEKDPQIIMKMWKDLSELMN